jgi:hypothetical protein
MLLNFTETSTQKSIAVNPTAVTSVFTAPQGEYEGKTVITLGQQPVLVEESFVEVVGQLNGALN